MQGNAVTYAWLLQQSGLKTLSCCSSNICWEPPPKERKASVFVQQQQDICSTIAYDCLDMMLACAHIKRICHHVHVSNNRCTDWQFRQCWPEAVSFKRAGPLCDLLVQAVKAGKTVCHWHECAHA